MIIDDLADIDIIRNDWVQKKAREEVQASENVNVRFVRSPELFIRYKASADFVFFDDRIRVGTFNVNGKMPSQDLASWVGGRSVGKPNENGEKEHVERLSPLLRRLSSLSLAESGTDSASLKGRFYHLLHTPGIT